MKLWNCWTLQLTGVNLMWIVFHAIFWDGNAANKEDIIDSLLSPGNMITWFCDNKPGNMSTWQNTGYLANQSFTVTTSFDWALPHILTHSGSTTAHLRPSKWLCKFLFLRSEDQFEGEHDGRRDPEGGPAGGQSLPRPCGHPGGGAPTKYHKIFLILTFSSLFPTSVSRSSGIFLPTLTRPPETCSSISAL